MTVQKFSSTAARFLFPLFVLVLLFVFSPPQAQALTNPQQYYDWGPYYPRVNPRVLGVAVSSNQPEASPPAKIDGAKNVAQFRGYFLGLGSGLTPGSPFYFLKKAQENLVLAVTLDPLKREELRLQVAGERLGELEKLVARGQSGRVADLSSDYQKTLATVAAHLDTLQNNTPQAGEALHKFEEESAKHDLVLEAVSANAPSSAQAGLARAIAASEKVVDTAADLSGRAALPIEVLDRVQALKSQGLLSPEESQKLISLTSRVDARAELKKFALEGIFPEVDILKLNELAKEKFAQSFNQIVEVKKFQELKKLEEEKPDEEILKKVQDFAKAYKAGDQVPPDLRRYWVPLVRLEELQNTIRPDLIDQNLIKFQGGDYKKFQEVVERLKPRPEDVAQIEKLISQNPNAALDPFYDRVRQMAGKFGTTEAGVQVPGVPVAAKSCPSNSHWASVPYMPDGGYCVPNITYAQYQSPSAEGENKTTAAPESVCPVKYHRNYPSGPCVPDAYFGSPVNYQTYTPGGYPSPVFPPAGCPGGYFWSGTTCLSGNSGPSNNPLPGTGGVPRTDMGNCRTPGECYDWCKANPSKCQGFSPDSPRPGDTQSVTPSHDSQEAACRSGGGTCVSWFNGACSCEHGSGGNAGTGNTGVCPTGQYRNNTGVCVSGGTPGGGANWSCPQGQYMGPAGSCISSYNGGGSPSRDSQEAACRSGGGTCVSWFNGACGCERSGQSSGTGGYYPSAGTNPPSGYGSCPSGQYWNGGSCVSNTYTTPASSPPPPSSPSPTPSPTPTPPPPSPSPSPSPTPPPSEPTPSYTPPSSPPPTP